MSVHEPSSISSNDNDPVYLCHFVANEILSQNLTHRLPRDVKETNGVNLT